ncbi:MAG: VTT domain-containing protein [Owenweeksia sp.]|nr:VTT domain-containing protein [Owenweeksia sp.]
MAAHKPQLRLYSLKNTDKKEEAASRKNRPLSFGERSYRYHNYFKRTGRYRFVGKNLLRLLLVIAAFATVVWLITEFVLDVDQMEKIIFSHLPDWLIFLTLFISECFTGILPPDMYIIWAQTFSYPYLIVFILAILSYMGGMISWFIGTKLHRLRRVKLWVDIKFADQVKLFKKYGGLVIFISALTPLPFSPVSVVAGMVKYPFKLYTLVALSRFARFFLYAYVFYQVL